MSVYEGHGDIIYPWQIDQRIEALKQSLPDYDGQHIVPDDFFNEDEREEYAALIQFREDVISECGGEKAWEDSPGFIAESYFDTYVNSDLEGMVGSDTIQILDKYIDWESVKDDYMERFEEIDFDGVTYLVDNSRG
jgi:hypothetical protein